ncbi:UNVERIFIED_CONTAM: hypothetical protein FKN15_061757 [Acipenser sinensis]
MEVGEEDPGREEEKNREAAESMGDEIERKGSVLVDYQDLLQDEGLSKSIPNLASELRDMPEKILDCMGLAVHQVLTKDLERHVAELQEQEGLASEEPPIVNVPCIHARVYNYNPLTPLKNLRANFYGKYVALRGTVVRVSNIKPLCTKMAFSCNMCGEIQSLPLADGKFTTPTKVGFGTSSGRPQLIQTTLDHLCLYKGWRLYFSEAYSESSPFVQKIQAFELFFTKRIELYDKDEIERKGSVLVDYQDLLQDEGLSKSIPNLASELRDMPEKILDCMGLAVHQVLTKDLERHVAELQEQEGLASEEPPIVNVPCIHARVYNYNPLTPLKNLRANFYGKYVALRGTVVRVSNIKPLCTKMAFSCNMCGEIQSLPLADGKFTTPTKCLQPECRGRSFLPNRSSPLTVTVDWQSIKVQELMSDDQREAGRIPRTIECELAQDLVDSSVPGDMVTITGIVKVSSSEEGSGRNKNDKCMFLLYIEANSISNSKGQKVKHSEESDSQGASMEFSLKDLYAIQEIQAEENLLKLIVNSLCPAIYGHTLVKAGLALALFGGCQKYIDDKNRIPVRGDPHMLVVGDPGLGKSQMLQAVCNIAPRGVYVCGNTTTTSGLTVTLSRDSGSGDFALEAGALVLGDQGICCIDEFDKMGNQHQALLEAMEQQSISLAKAGIVCSLPARTSVIAAANPVGGHYNKAKTVSENLKMGSALLSRFDLVFILLDTPNEAHDHMLSEHVMAMRSGRQGAVASATVTRGNDPNTSILEVFSDKPLLERLKMGNQHQALLEAMEQQSISLAKAGIVCSLPARTSVIAAANPVGGHYNKAKTVSENLKMGSALLSRFDLVFILLDTPNEAHDHMLSEHVMAMRSGRQGAVASATVTRGNDPNTSILEVFSDKPLLERLKVLPGENCDPIPHQLLRKYVGYARHYVRPRLSVEAAQVLQEFYLELRKQNLGADSTPITTRQLESLIRLTEVADFEGFISSLNDQGYLLKKGAKVYQLQTM